MQIHSHAEFDPSSNQPTEQGLQRVLQRLVQTMQRDALVRQTTNRLRESLQIDRVVLYYFYWQWHGQVTFEALSSEEFSILGSTGADECFNDEYAELYLAGRTKAIADIESASITPCHRDFLRTLQVRANLVVPVLVPKGLWGLLVAHHCQGTRFWTESDIELMQTGAKTLATSPYILES
ncbi:possible Sensor with GAF domain [Trichormus variabilis ATCC 29413]|uniref:Possible Sensor with GAF domain n=2 Tax=Anabaena variabilis TaxID=264691 RepID=Q3M874_TRIV2|nr:MULTISPECIES: GAF domain-containing protein [Nostocaceae]ABA22812.1 possible Sensor with GAF domain [Trichormus variabilis ATCC 29413]MBC1215107.1 GAF domain-containing protein [Trichormus variabilis ARAD]MBC1255672.1 GAF domain-containing protein [Trichormus variabilis V5]MBC1267287.1 GAF domain-containing protein [Trichormus variabilis FSR]MBC1303800.1 GAF domain-containing protein [Trichormus variabilis N2B]